MQWLHEQHGTKIWQTLPRLPSFLGLHPYTQTYFANYYYVRSVVRYEWRQKCLYLNYRFQEIDNKADL
jgi:hypothetical protein